MIGERHHYQVARRQGGDRLAVQIVMRGIGIGVETGPSFEPTRGKGAPQHRGVGERAHRPAMLRADSDRTDASQSLQLIQRRQNLVVGDHSSADQSYPQGSQSDPRRGGSGRGTLQRFREGFFQNAGAFDDSFFGDHQGRADLDCCAAQSNRGKHQHALFEA